MHSRVKDVMRNCSRYGVSYIQLQRVSAYPIGKPVLEGIPFIYELICNLNQKKYGTCRKQIMLVLKKEHYAQEEQRQCNAVWQIFLVLDGARHSQKI